MTSFQYDYIVSKSEVEELKEMIFKRVRERAAAVANDANEKYTTSVKYDVMELAHDSFVKSQNNPFSQIVDDNSSINNNTEKSKSPELQGIGFSPRKKIKDDFANKNTEIAKDLSDKAVEMNMNEARMDFAKNSSFTGALEFLNSQASISLNGKRNKKIDVVA